jgi:predicted AlkP superfamily pyrophosphatase or phosphodiesterase
VKNLQSVICALLFLSFGIFAQTDSAKREKKVKEKLPPLTSHVILISIDGMRIEDLTNSKLNLPTLKALHELGAFALNVESVYPSHSIPAHASIITGMLPADHGICANAPFDEKKARTSAENYHFASDLKADTLWQAAKRAGLKTAAIKFPLTEKAEIDFVSQTLATELIEKNRPQLLMINFDEVANSLQRFGMGSIEATTAMEKVDASLKTILDAVERTGLTNETTFLIVSSHGYARVEQEFRPNVILARKGFLTADVSGNITSWIAAARASGGAAAIYLQDQQNEETVKSLEEIFTEIQRQEASPIWRVLSKKDAAKLGADPRAALFLEAAPGFIISEHAVGKKFTEKVASSAERATSGYLPTRSEMRGMLIAAGKGVKPKTRIEYARLVDIAPTIARLLGLELKASRGRAISGIFIQ